MKRLHRSDLYAWSVFNETHNIDFHSTLWVRKSGNVLIDPLPLSPHDAAHLHEFGPLACIVVTNSDHLRDSVAISQKTGAPVFGPAGEREQFPLACARWLSEGDEVVAGLRVFALEGSKTPGELALLLEESTLITGDLIRAHEGGRLSLLPDAKLSDKGQAVASLARLAALPQLDAVLTGDGWPVFRDGKKALEDLLKRSGDARRSNRSL